MKKKIKYFRESNIPKNKQTRIVDLLYVPRVIHGEHEAKSTLYLTIKQ